MLPKKPTKPADYRVFTALIVTGVVAGLGAAGFLAMLEAAVGFFLGYVGHYHPPTPGYEQPMFHFYSGGDGPIRWVLLVLPMAGGLISGLITYFAAPEIEGHGTDAAIHSYHFQDGKVRRRVPLLKAITSALTIGTGGSGGREGPIAQIGSGFGSMLADWLGLPPHIRRQLMAAGMAAGIGAIFHAPLAGALFSSEVMYSKSDIESEVLLSSFVTCIVAYCVFGGIYGFDPLFMTPHYAFTDPWLLLPYLILAVVCAGGAYLYVRVFYGVHRLSKRVRWLPNHVKPMLGGLATGIVGFFIPEALGTGYGVLQTCFDADAGGTGSFSRLLSFGWLHEALGATASGSTIAVVALLALIAVAKIGTTAFSIGTGGSGGIFGPAVVIGGAIGGATGYLCQMIFPGLEIQPGAFALVGMAGFFAGAANTPMSTIIMVSEMTGNYNLLIPAMCVCAITYFLCRRVKLYEEQLPSHFDSPSKIKLMGRTFLTQVKVGQIMRLLPKKPLPEIRQDMEGEELLRQTEDVERSFLPVVDDKGLTVGIISTRSIQEQADALTSGAPIIAKDLLRRTPVVGSDDSLLSVCNRLRQNDLPEIPVVDRDDFSKLQGLISEAEVFSAHSRWIEDND